MTPRLRRFVVDTSAFRVSRDYRLLLIGGLVNRVGSAVTLVALPTQMFVLTRSPLLLNPAIRRRAKAQVSEL